MSIINLSPDVVTPYLRELAEEIMLPKYKTLTEEETRHKSPGDLVTVVDIEMERRLNEILPALLPGSIVIGEEAVSDNPNLLASAKGEDLVWLVDPLDGTNNFVQGKRAFCVMVALHYKGEVVLSCIYDPLGEKTVVAEKGQGSFSNGTRLHCPKPLNLDEMMGQINYGMIQDKEIRTRFKEKSENTFSKIERLGCAGHDFIDHAEGKRHFSLYRRLAPWDFAPGGLILKEAGGCLKLFDGTDLDPFEHAHGLLTATSEENWQGLYEYFKPSLSNV